MYKISLKVLPVMVGGWCVCVCGGGGGGGGGVLLVGLRDGSDSSFFRM